MIRIVDTFVRVVVPGEGVAATAVGTTGHVHTGETDCAACAATLLQHGWREVVRRRRLTLLEETGDVLAAEDVTEPAPAPVPGGSTPRSRRRA